MNKVAFKNFFKVLLAGLLIIAMLLMQLEDISPLAFWITFIIVLVSVVFVLLQTTKVSKQYDRLQEENMQLKAKIRELEVGKLEDVEKDKENK
jgi:membrane protein implicated in regulation of membrane protease activity